MSPALALGLPSSRHHVSVVVSVVAAGLLSLQPMLSRHACCTPPMGINSPPPARSSSSRDSQGTALVLGHALETCPRHPPPPGLSSQLPSPACSLCGPLYGSLSGPVLSWWQSPGKTPISHQAVARGPSLTSPPTCVPGCWSCSSLCFFIQVSLILLHTPERYV